MSIWELSLSGKTKVTELPQIEEFEKKEEKVKSKTKELGVSQKDDEET